MRATMHAALGDRIAVESAETGPDLVGEIVELRHPDGTPPYVVRWSESGRDSVFFPQEDRVEPVGPLPAVTTTADDAGGC